MIGSFLSNRAENLRSQSYETTLQTTQFYIDLEFESRNESNADEESVDAETPENTDDSEETPEENE